MRGLRRGVAYPETLYREGRCEECHQVTASYTGAVLREWTSERMSDVMPMETSVKGEAHEEV